MTPQRPHAQLMLLVNDDDDDDDDDDVGFSFAFLYDSSMFCVFFKYFLKFIFVCVRVGVCMID